MSPRYGSAARTTTEEDQMVSIDAEVVSTGNLREQRLHGVVTDLPLTATNAADQMVVWREPRDLVVGLANASVCRHDDAQLDEQPDRTIDR